MRSLLAFVSVSSICFALWAGCGGTQATSGGDGNPSGTSGMPSAASACVPCVTDQDCNGAVCAQLGSDSYCAPACPNGSECSSDRSCVSASSVTGQQVSVCVPRADVCSSAPGAQDGGNASGTCGALVGPDVTSNCTSCTGKKNCQTNGCFGGWWCDTATKRCQAPPSGCGPAGASLDAGAPATGTVTGNGGSLSRLFFAVVGDTRPPSINDTAAYPSTIIDKIYGDIQAFTPRPAFVVSTGDYMFASSFSAESGPQLDKYLAARAKFDGPLFPAMGNHECTGATTSNCGSGAADGVTNNFTSFLNKMLGPIGKSDPYYAININATDNSWTAKFVFIAANAWSTAQESWLNTTLAQNTTYTFVVRHESRMANTAPGVKPSEQIMAQHPYTLAIVGHTHTYEHPSGREVIIGNGGAPLTGGKNYGFGVFSQRPDGAIQVDMVDYSSGSSDTQFRFAVKPDGSPTP